MAPAQRTSRVYKACERRASGPGESRYALSRESDGRGGWRGARIVCPGKELGLCLEAPGG